MKKVFYLFLLLNFFVLNCEKKTDIEASYIPSVSFCGAFLPLIDDDSNSVEKSAMNFLYGKIENCEVYKLIDDESDDINVDPNPPVCTVSSCETEHQKFINEFYEKLKEKGLYFAGYDIFRYRLSIPSSVFNTSIDNSENKAVVSDQSHYLKCDFVPEKLVFDDVIPAIKDFKLFYGDENIFGKKITIIPDFSLGMANNFNDSLKIYKQTFTAKHAVIVTPPHWDGIKLLDGSDVYFGRIMLYEDKEGLFYYLSESSTSLHTYMTDPAPFSFFHDTLLESKGSYNECNTVGFEKYFEEHFKGIKDFENLKSCWYVPKAYCLLNFYKKGFSNDPDPFYEPCEPDPLTGKKCISE